MPLDLPAVKPKNATKVKYLNYLYRMALITFLIYICIAATIGVRQVFVISDKLDDRTNYILNSQRCIVDFFTRPNRANLKIEDVDKCTLTPN